MKRIVASAFMALLLLGSSDFSAAQEWPSRPVRIVSPFSAGGTADILARMVAEHLSTTFKQQFYVEARPGAAGAIGLQAVASSEPDGHNLLLGSVSVLTLLPIVNPKIGYDSLRDLTNIAYVAGAPAVLTVNPVSGIKTLPDFVEKAKRAEKPFSYSSSGMGSDGHLLGEAFTSLAKIPAQHVPYRGAQPALTDIAGGHVMFGLLTLSSSAPFLQGKTVSGLAVTSAERMTDYPDIPTFNELGYPDMVSTTWFSLSGPAKLPSHIAEKLNRAVTDALAKPEVKQKLQQTGLITNAMSVDEFGKFLQTEANRWRPLIERAGLVQK
jgi:tripartite-type tricarboxylate transporter receptor subunit TctC